ncbi:hypothetical protein T4D_8039 [Trichinella pseudospiralis]|uniref:Uncharacterized protein n=1 Tax=Trichinella pseudospiralis TaxID=6337 RepID=A0A0V1FVT2_TRIPS|nr:hypothetical protein T4D_8039 [Trichinella pseudospiralis]
MNGAQRIMVRTEKSVILPKGVIVLFSAVSIHILPLNGVLRSNGCQQAITFRSPHFNPNSLKSVCLYLYHLFNQHISLLVRRLSPIVSERQNILSIDDYLPVCFLSLTCDASFPPHFSYTPTKNIVPLPARMTYPNAAMKGVPQNDLLISCWCSTVCHVASSTTVSPFPTPEIQHYMLQSRQQTATLGFLIFVLVILYPQIPIDFPCFNQLSNVLVFRSVRLTAPNL